MALVKHPALHVRLLYVYIIIVIFLYNVGFLVYNTDIEKHYYKGE